MIERILSIVISVPIIFLCTYFGGIPFFLLVTLLALVSVNEFYNLMKKKGFTPFYTIGNIFTLFITSFAQFTLKHPNWEPASSAILTAAIIITFSAGVFIKRTAVSTANIAITLLGILYIGWLFSFLVLVRSLTPHGAYLFFLMISIWANDIVAYLVGKKIGKTQLSPYISPKKTLEGAVAGFFTAILASYVFYLLAKQFLVQTDLIHYLILGGIIGIIGQISDLAESLIKRDAGVKDSSNLVPGHGGVLDRMDSFIFTAPLLYYYVSWLIVR